MIPTAGTTDFHDVNRELLLRRRKANEFVSCARRTRECPQLLAEHPRDEGELLLAADRACDVATAAVELGRTQ